MDKLSNGDLKVILDILNVYDPNDIKHVYSAMGSQEFLVEVNETFQKVLSFVKKGVDLIEKPVILEE
jgi:hypothetical protein|tara:strand:+ start:357 stop:557 length:201 start_codon:yes stop_codon:yes gene_type:complete